MNEKNVRAAIDIMRRAKNLQMCAFQTGFPLATTETELHACGNTPCFAGYVAISPEFQAAGGQCRAFGVPQLGESYEEYAIAEWLGISDELADSMVYGGDNSFYPVPFRDVKPEHVIAVRERILAGELS